MIYCTKAISGPKGKIVTAYAVADSDGSETARYRIRHEGKGNWRYAKKLAQDHAERLNVGATVGDIVPAREG